MVYEDHACKGYKKGRECHNSEIETLINKSSNVENIQALIFFKIIISQLLLQLKFSELWDH